MNKFQLELSKLGRTNKERATALGVTTKSIERYQAGDLPSIILRLQAFPELLRALAEDAEIYEDKEEVCVKEMAA